MDLQEWELLPHDGFLEIHDDGGKKIFSRKYGHDSIKNVFNTNYFICPSPKPSTNQAQNQRVSNQVVVPVPIQLVRTTSDDHKAVDHGEVVKDVITKIPIHQEAKGGLKSDRETVSQVFFKKMEENEFVDMKIDSPKSSGRGIVHQVDAVKFQFEKRNEEEKKIETKQMNMESDAKEEEVNSWEDKNGGMKLWKWTLTGIGAVCSFGFVAAATISIIIIGTHQKNKQQQQQKLRFQIYADDKRRIKEVVQHAAKLNESISASISVPLSTRAQINNGGYFDGL